MKSFGKASEFYRVKLVALTENQPEEFDWKDDILYRNQPDRFDVVNKTEHMIIIVDIDTGENFYVRPYSSRPKAQKKFDIIEKNLKELTKIQFDKRYRAHKEEPFDPHS